MFGISPELQRRCMFHGLSAANHMSACHSPPQSRVPWVPGRAGGVRSRFAAPESGAVLALLQLDALHRLGFGMARHVCVSQDRPEKSLKESLRMSALTAPGLAHSHCSKSYVPWSPCDQFLYCTGILGAASGINSKRSADKLAWSSHSDAPESRRIWANSFHNI